MRDESPNRMTKTFFVCSRSSPISNVLVASIAEMSCNGDSTTKIFTYIKVPALISKIPPKENREAYLYLLSHRMASHMHKPCFPAHINHLMLQPNGGEINR